MSETVSTQTYLDLITNEHEGQPNFTATVSLSVQPFVDEQNVLLAMPGEYDLDVAAGAQLDAVGLWVGVSRFVSTPLANVYFTWGSASLGWGLGTWKGPYDPSTGLVELDDSTYRLLITTRIAANEWDGTVAGAAAALATLFNETTTPGTLLFIEDNFNMTMTFAVAGQLPPAVFLALLANGEIPLVPVGVSANYVVTSESGSPCFGWGESNEYVAGWGTGAWAGPIVP
jgi:uncharacterized protein DUF2612